MGVLDGKSALITGGTKGLGAELAVALARAGADIVVLGRDKAAGDQVAAAIAETGRRVLVIAADVTDEAQMDAAAAQARAAFGRIDILVCTAGVGTARQPLWEQGAAEFRATYDVNVLGCMLAMRSVIPVMIEQRAGRIINIGGTYGHKGIPLSAVYASTKWALRGLTKSVALEVGQYGITANVVAPGGVEGPRLTREFSKSADKEGLTYQAVVDRFTSRSALGRLVTGDEIAAAVIHLASDAGRNVTGQDLVVDAGVII